VSPDAVVGVVYTDVLIGREPKGKSAPIDTPSAQALTLEPLTIPLLKGELEEVRDTWIEIRNLPGMELVTIIEVLSPTNKIGAGRVEYLDKRDGYIDRPVNLVELDLLLGGRRLPMKRPMPQGDYFALVARAERRPDCEVYALSIRQSLPAIPIPLRTPDPDVALDLAKVFALAYDRGRYGRTVDYGRPLDLPLQPEDRIWAEHVAIGSMGRP
jgi:Protein of unknown function (DUF4058)